MAGNEVKGDDGLVMQRSSTTRIRVKPTRNINQDWLSIQMEKMVKDKWFMTKGIQLLPEEWKKIRELELEGGE